MARILYACTAMHGFGGIQRFNRNVISALVDSGVAVDVLSLNDRQDDAAEFMRTSNISCYYTNRSKGRWIGRLVRLLLTNRYDTVVCAHVNLVPAVACALALTGRGFKGTCLLMHGIEIWGRVDGLKRLAARRIELACAVSQYTRESFLSQMPSFNPAAVLVFPNTLSLNCLQQQVDDERPYVKNGVLKLLSVTRLDVSERSKGIVDVLQALAQLVEEIEFRYEIIGDGNDRHFLTQTAREHGLADRVTFLGSVPDEEMWSAYRRADVFILPSNKEGMGIVFLEAMYFALPIIGANEKGAVDAFIDGKNGFLVPYQGVDDIAKRLILLARSPGLCADMGRLGRSLVTGNGQFSRDAFAQRIRDVFVSQHHSQTKHPLEPARSAPTN